MREADESLERPPIFTSNAASSRKPAITALAWTFSSDVLTLLWAFQEPLGIEVSQSMTVYLAVGYLLLGMAGAGGIYAFMTLVQNVRKRAFLPAVLYSLPAFLLGSLGPLGIFAVWQYAIGV